MELNSRQKYFLKTLNEYKAYIIIPMLAGMFLSLVYVFVFRSQSWTTRQRLLVRDDLLGQAFKPGQFSSFDSMKSRQETILDIARNPDVIRNALQEVGNTTTSWFLGSDVQPDDQTIESVQGQINLSAPNGAEFGTTEVVVLSVKASSADRSMNLISALVTQVERQIEKVRQSQLQSMEAELQVARDNAKNALQQSIDQLRQMELLLGIDSVTMANMTSAMPGDNSIKTETLQILAEKRGFQAQLESLKMSLRTLEEARGNPLLVISSSGGFFKDLVKLNELTKSFAESQKTYAIAAGKYQPAHPFMEHVSEQLETVKNQIAEELDTLTLTLNSQIEEFEQRIVRLDQLIEANHQRLKILNEKRGDHIAINAEIAKRNETLNQCEAMLKNVQVFHSDKGGAVWVTRIGQPQTASRPDGLSKRAMILAGGGLGFLFGAGLVVLLAPPDLTDPTQRNRAEGIYETASPATTRNPRDSRHPIEAVARPPQRPSPPSRNFQPSVTPTIEIPYSATETTGVNLAHSLGNQTFEHSSQPTVDHGSLTKPTLSAEDEQDRKLKHIEKFLAKKKSSAAPRPQPDELERAKEATLQMNVATVKNEDNKAEELLAEFRAHRALQTDPLAHLKSSQKNPWNESVQSDWRLETSVDAVHQATAGACVSPGSGPDEETNFHDQISQRQQVLSKSEPVQPIQQALGSRQSNLFLNRQGKTNRDGESSAKVSIPTLPDQIKAISDSIIGLVESSSR